MTVWPAAIALVSSRRLERSDGIGDYTANLAAELRRQGPVVVDLISRDDDGWAAATSEGGIAHHASLASAAERYDTVLLQYNPYMYGPWGFAPWLLPTVARLRFRGTPLVLFVHEGFVGVDDWRTALTAAWQRTQLGVLRSFADLVVTTRGRWLVSTRTWWPRRETLVVPSGSNLPDARAEREHERARLALRPGELVVAVFGSAANRSYLESYVAVAVNAIVERMPVRLLVLGAGAAPVTALDPAVVVETPGLLPAHELATRLTAADLFLAPYYDGVSVGRTTLAAALQHALPVVATLGTFSDDLLRTGDGLWTAPLEQPERFAELALRLALDADVRRDLGARGRELYEREFAWPVIARRLLEACRPLERR